MEHLQELDQFMADKKILPLLPPLPCSGIRVVGGWEVEEIFDNVLVAGL